MKHSELRHQPRHVNPRIQDAYIWPRITNKIPNPFAASRYSNLVLSFIIHHPNFRFLQSLLAILYFHIFIGKNLRINIDSFYNIKHFFLV